MAIDRIYMDSNCFIESVQSRSDSQSPHANDLWYIRQFMEAASKGDIEIDFIKRLEAGEDLLEANFLDAAERIEEAMWPQILD